MIILLWKYAPIMAMVDRVLSAGQMKVDKAEVDKMKEKIGKLPEDTVKQLILQVFFSFLMPVLYFILILVDCAE